MKRPELIIVDDLEFNEPVDKVAMKKWFGADLNIPDNVSPFPGPSKITNIPGFILDPKPMTMDDLKVKK